MSPLGLSNAKPPLKFQAYETIKEMITSHQIAPDRAITEMDLSKILRMGRTPIREALNLLSKDGIIQLVPHKGAVLKPVSYENLIQIYQIREVLDPLAAQQAIGRIDLAHLKEIEKRYIRREDTDQRAGQDFSRELHSLIYRSCLNPYLTEIFEGLHVRMQVCLHSLWELWARADDHRLMARRKQEHLAIIRALRKRDAEGAAHISRLHISRALDDILHLMATERPVPSPTAALGKSGRSLRNRSSLRPPLRNK